MKISLIEDEPDCSDDFSIILRSVGHEVFVYNDADSAVIALEKICSSEVLILDLMMQLGNMVKTEEGLETGIALYKRIRKVAPKLPILVITARSKPEIWDDFSADNKVQYLGKPVASKATLVEAIERAVK